VKIKPVKLLQEALGPALPLGDCLRPPIVRRLPKNRFVRKKKRKKKKKKEKRRPLQLSSQKNE
jgi:hypothetical protein